MNKQTKCKTNQWLRCSAFSPVGVTMKVEDIAVDKPKPIMVKRKVAMATKRVNTYYCTR